MVMCDGELGEVGKWSDQAKKAKGGTVLHQTPDISGHKKMCCDKMMGQKCDCESLMNKGKKDS